MRLLNPKSVVVVPWDFSDQSRKALDQAMELVNDVSQIRVINIAFMPTMVGPGMMPPSVDEETTIENSEIRFREAVADNPDFKDISYTTLVMQEIGHSICDFAKKEKADMIVISSHGRTGFARLALGSVAERVVRYAPCPVLVLRS